MPFYRERPNRQKPLHNFVRENYIKPGFRFHFTGFFEAEVISGLKNTKNLPVAQIKEKEGKAMLLRLQPVDFVVLLDEKGKGMTSEKFADFLKKQMNVRVKNLVFVIGGANGFSEV